MFKWDMEIVERGDMMEIVRMIERRARELGRLECGKLSKNPYVAASAKEDFEKRSKELDKIKAQLAKYNEIG